MRKIMSVKNRVNEVRAKLQVKTLQIFNKLNEVDGSLLEYLEESVIGVVLLAVIIAGLLLIISTIVFPQLSESIKSAFSAATK